MKTLTALIVLLACLQATAQSNAAPKQPFATKVEKAYARKAEAKVTEFYSYLELLTDPNIKEEIKEQVSESALKLFYTDIKTDNIFEVKATGATVPSVLQSAVGQRKKHSFIIKNFSIEPRQTSPEKSKWLMAYQLISNGVVYNVTQDYYIVEEDKQFGNTTKKVSNAYLGTITLHRQ